MNRVEKEQLKSAKFDRVFFYVITIVLLLMLGILGSIMGSKIDRLEAENEILKQETWTLNAYCEWDEIGIRSTTSIEFTNHKKYLETLESMNLDGCEIIE